MIETKRLVLRPFSEEDADLIYRIYSDREILHYTPYDRMNREQAKEHLQSVIRDWECSPRLSYEMAAVLKESGEAIGRAHILIDEETGDGMIGWFLLKAYWGRHYASEMTAGLIDYCFNTLHLRRIYAVCSPENTASRRVLENSGMRLLSVTEKKCRYLKDGVASWHDEAEYELFNEPPEVTG